MRISLSEGSKGVSVSKVYFSYSASFFTIDLRGVYGSLFSFSDSTASVLNGFINVYLPIKYRRIQRYYLTRQTLKPQINIFKTNPKVFNIYYNHFYIPNNI